MSHADKLDIEGDAELDFFFNDYEVISEEPEESSEEPAAPIALTLVETLTPRSRAEECAVLIEEFTAIKEIRQGTYNRLHSTVASCENTEHAVTLLDEAELIFINSNFTLEQVKQETTKNGKVKRTKFLPNDYLSAKSILISAMQQGTPLFDEDGAALGKSALSAEVSGSTKSVEAKLESALSNVKRYARELYPDHTVDVDLIVNGSKINY